MVLLYLIISFLASIVGAICGIGGGVIIKPVLDMFALASVATISFLSSCTVLSMSLYSVSRSFLAGDSLVELKRAVPLSVGAILGGILGNGAFQAVTAAMPGVGAVQAVSLAGLTLGTLLYTIFEKRIKTYDIHNTVICLVLGLLLGALSSFLGIGGGPINLIVLSFFFSMDSKTAAQNSLYIILFSQVANILFSLLRGTVPPFDWLPLVLMVVGGIGGGMAGRALNRKMSNDNVAMLFKVLMAAIICVSVYNYFHLR